jgi:uncharacterized protein
MEPIMGVHSEQERAGLFGATRQAVLRIVFGRPEQRYFQRQIIDMVGLGSGTVQRELKNLFRIGILSRTVEGRQTYYQANPSSPIFPEIRGLVRKTFGVTDTLRAALQPLAKRIRVAFVFGSVAEGREKAGSDVDLMIVGDQLSMADVTDALATAQDELQREINPSIYPTGEFCRKLSEGHHFLTQVVRDGPKLFLVGDDAGLKRLAEEWLAQGAPNKQGGDRRPARRRR